MVFGLADKLHTDWQNKAFQRLVKNHCAHIFKKQDAQPTEVLSFFATAHSLATVE